MKGRFIGGDRVEFEHEFRSAKGYGTAQAKCYYDTPDPCVGYTGGWVVEEVTVNGVPMDAREFERRYGFGAMADLQNVAVEDAYQHFVIGDPDREEPEWED